MQPPIGRALFRHAPRVVSTPSVMILSATGAMVPDLLQQSFGGFFDEIQCVLEPARSSVVGVGDLAFGRVGRVVEEGPHHGVSPAERRDRPVILLVHRQDVVESLAVFGVKESGPLARDVYPAGSHALLRPRVRRPPGMVEAVGARRVNRYLAGQSLAPGSVLEDALCHRTAADIPRADEQDAYHARNFMVRSRAFQVALGALPGRLRGRAGRPGPGRRPARSQPSRVAWSSAFARGRTLDILDATVGHGRDDGRVHCNQYTAQQAASPLHRITLDDITTSSSSSFGNASDVRNTSEASTRRLT